MAVEAHFEPMMKMAKQSGAALLTVLTIVALIAGVTAKFSGIGAQTSYAIARDAHWAQANWLLNGAIDWSKVILREDQATSKAVDHLAEPWAIPISQFDVSSFVASNKEDWRRTDLPDIRLSGRIRDAQSKINLNMTSEGDREYLNGVLARLNDRGFQQKTPWQLTLKRLGGTDSSNVQVIQGPIWWFDLPDTEQAKPMERWVTYLPSPTPVNLNTAPLEVVYATIPEFSIAQAQQLVDSRRLEPFNNIADVERRFPSLAGRLSTKRFATVTSYFVIEGEVTVAGVRAARRALANRKPGEVTIVDSVQVVATQAP